MNVVTSRARNFSGFALAGFRECLNLKVENFFNGKKFEIFMFFWA